MKKSDPIWDFTERIGKLRQTKLSVLTIYVITIVFLAARHEPWDDEYHVWYMTYNMSLGELIDSMRVEGHFCLWHLCVLPWVKLFGMDYHALYIASISLMTLAVWLLLYKVHFSFIGKLFIIFSAPFIYHFPIIARCYALIPPIVMGIVSVYQKKKSPVLFCLLLGLLAHTHAYMEGLVAILWILFVYFYVVKEWKHDANRAKHNLLYSFITVIFVLLAFVQISGSVTDAGNGLSPAFVNRDSDYEWINSFFAYHRVKVFNLTKHVISDNVPNFDLSATLLIYLSILWYFFAVLQKQNRIIRFSCVIVLVVSVIWQVLFATNIYYMGFQRVYLVCVPIFMILGMLYSHSILRQSSAIMILFWLINTPCQSVVAKDITHVYNYDALSARELESILPVDAEIYTTGNVSCLALMKRQIHCISNPNISSDNLCTTELIECLSDQSNQTCYLITRNNLDSMHFNGCKLELIYKGICGFGEIVNIAHGQQSKCDFNLYLISYAKDN